ncbi:MAG: hypothetical protein P1V51_11760 [Deltaproteobacteria bacterium]|nr:hypothetical protein [Deltaproteobacteria bacterium]
MGDPGRAMSLERIITLELGGATLELELRCGSEQRSAGDLTRLGFWSFPIDALRRVVPGEFRHLYAEVGGEHLGKPLWDEIDDALESGEPWVELQDADTSIMILALLAAAGGPARARYVSEGSSFWAFHDLSHVRRDAWLEEGRGGLRRVEARDEDRAHVEGAREALAHGVITMAEIARALVTSEQAFLHRFGQPSRALDHLLAEAS